MEMLRFAMSPPYRARGRRHISRIEREGDFDLAYFRGMDRPLYWPAELPLETLLMVVSEQFDADDWHQYETVETTVRADDVVVDCGAAEGLFALRVAKRCRRVYAVEPYPRFVQSMGLTFAGLGNVEVLEYLLGERDGPASLSGDGITAGEGNRGLDVKMRSLDSLFPPGSDGPTYLKADIEGAEVRMLLGAAGLIRRTRPRIAITTYHDPSHADDIARMLRAIEPRYQTRTKGWSSFGTPLMLHAWVD